MKIRLFELEYLDHDSVNGFAELISDICIYLFMPFNLIVVADTSFLKLLVLCMIKVTNNISYVFNSRIKEVNFGNW